MNNHDQIIKERIEIIISNRLAIIVVFSLWYFDNFILNFAAF